MAAPGKSLQQEPRSEARRISREAQAISRARALSARDGAWLVIHGEHCDGEVDTDGSGCTCIPYRVHPKDPRPSVLILQAAEARQRVH